MYNEKEDREVNKIVMFNVLDVQFLEERGMVTITYKGKRCHNIIEDTEAYENRDPRF